LSALDRIRVWDLPTRVFHWALVVLVVFSFTTGTIGGSGLAWHMKSGYAILALLIFRVAWGLVGSETARFAQFIRGPRAAFAYARETWAARHTHVVGHNPLGGWMVVLMIALLLAQAATGLFADDEISTQGPLAGKVSNAVVARMTAFHHYNEWTLVAVVALHVIAIAFYRLRLKTDLVTPMVTGWRTLPADVRAAQPRHRSSLAALVLLGLAAGFVYGLVVVYPKG
jgi:cytochrome b